MNYIKDLVEESLNEACLVIQTKIGIDDGGYAGMFFSDDIVRNKLKAYIIAELENKVEKLESLISDMYDNANGDDVTVVDANYDKYRTELDTLNDILITESYQ